jgi:hypothetical protein
MEIFVKHMYVTATGLSITDAYRTGQIIFIYLKNVTVMDSSPMPGDCIIFMNKVNIFSC